MVYNGTDSVIPLATTALPGGEWSEVDEDDFLLAGAVANGYVSIQQGSDTDEGGDEPPDETPDDQSQSS
jgi:hypothetical protein